MSEDSSSDYSAHNDFLPPSAVDYYQVQSPIDFCQPESVFSDHTRFVNEQEQACFLPFQDVTTIKPTPDHIRSPITEATFWQPVPENVPGMTNPPQMEVPLYGTYTGQNASPNATAREHPLYQAGPNPLDNLYHCPFAFSDGCRHKPDKLKCNYE